MIKKIKEISFLLHGKIQKNISYRNYVLILSFIVGILSGLAAIILKWAVHHTSLLLTQWFSEKEVNYIYVVYPFFGILLTILFVKFFVKENIKHGISYILYSISKKNSLIESHNTYSSMIASTLTVGFGGSVGLEAPIVLTGSSIGSNIGRFLKLNYKTTTLLVGCGAAGAIAGIFKAPVAALVFALEVLMLDLTMWSLIPLLISSVTAATMSYIMSGKGFVFTVANEGSFYLHNLPFYILLGIVCGLVSVFFTRGVIMAESKMEKIKTDTQKLIIGTLILGFLIFLLPPLYGEGYQALTSILNGKSIELADGSIFYNLRDNFWYFSGFLFLILFFKVFATAVTTSSGGVGGIFAPTLFMGGVTGLIFSRFINLLHFVSIPEKNLVLTGMAGVMAGVMHAPLTGIFLIAEITGGYQLFVPLMITATISYITINRFEGHSIYTHRLAKRGQLITHDKDRAVLTRLHIDRVVETDLKKIKPGSNLGEIVKIIASSKRNIFPVIDENNRLIGVVFLDNIREIIFNTDLYDKITVESIMEIPPTLIDYDETMENALEKFEISGAWNLPVIKDEQYYGYISKSKLFSIYRKRLKDITDD